MRIGIDATVLHGQYSGVEIAVRGLLRGLMQADHENEYVLFRGSDDALAEELPPNFAWAPQRFAGGAKLRRILFQQRELPRLARRLGLDVLHGPAYVTPMRCRVPMVASVYDLMVFLHPSLCDRPNRLHYRWVLPRCLARCARVLAPSTAVAESLVERLGLARERVLLAPLAIDERFRPVTDEATLRRAREQWDLPERFLLFVGNIEPKKGLELLLRALRELWDRRRERVPLVVVGARAWGADAFDRVLRETGTSEMVRALGYVPDEGLPALYSLATAFVFPSIYEGFGLPPLEAMACGAPTLVSDGGALPETVGEGALIVPSGDLAALVDGMARILGDEELRSGLSKPAATRVAEFSWVRHARAAIRAYEESTDGE
jgi:glycosyltransferase involved in cell wall biosynthesis